MKPLTGKALPTFKGPVRNLQDTTLLVKTFNRPQACKRLVVSALEYYDWGEIIVVANWKERDFLLLEIKPFIDAGKVQLICPPFESEFHNVNSAGLYSEFNFGRNFGLDLIETPYMVYSDHDVVFTENTRLDLVLQAVVNHDLQLCCPQQWLGENFWGLLRMFNGVLDRLPLEVHEELGPGIFRVDYGANFFAAETKAVQMIRWDNLCPIGGEHFDFFWRFSRAFNVGTRPESIALHVKPKEEENPLYLEGRNMFGVQDIQSASREYLSRKYGLDEFNWWEV